MPISASITAVPTIFRAGKVLISIIAIIDAFRAWGASRWQAHARWNRAPGHSVQSGPAARASDLKGHARNEI
jgi:hypothetical protein